MHEREQASPWREPWAKTYAHFLPLAALPVHESDRHYREVHTRWARGFLRELPDVVSYATDRVLAERDPAGGWGQRPRAFRFISMRYRPGSHLDLPPELRERVVQDHRNCLRELRSFRVREHVLVDRLRGGTGLAKLVVELDRRPGTSAGDAATRLAGGLEVLAEQAQDAFGLRQLLVDHVQHEAATEPLDEPGQRPTGRMLPDTARSAFVELWFDHTDWADEWLARPAVAAVLQDAWWAAARTYQVHEECGMDRR